MYANVNCGALIGIDAEPVFVEADITLGLPSLTIVGLPDTSVKEAKERVRTAILNGGYKFPSNRITVNLAPANTKKEGSHFDLAIAVSIMASAGIVSRASLSDIVLLGELTLDGRVCRIPGALAIVIGLNKRGVKRFIIPMDNKEEISILKGIEAYGVETLSETVDFLKKKNRLPTVAATVSKSENKKKPNQKEERENLTLDFRDIVGQETGVRAALISAASLHHLLLIGSAGAGKSMLAERIPTIMPPLSYEEKIELTRIYSAAGLLSDETPFITQPPFRKIHSTSSGIAMVGGGRRPKPGEITLAHHGVLYLDELPEFPRTAIEALRQPLESESIAVSRVSGKVIFPAKFLMVAAMNACPCGNYGDETKTCTCTEWQRQRYISKISGPILDRIDMVLEIAPVEYYHVRDSCVGMSSHEMKTMVTEARHIQAERFQDENITYNSQMGKEDIEKYCKLDFATQELLETAFNRLGMSVGGYYKILKVARTIADLEGAKYIESHHVAEAIRYKGAAFGRISS